MILVQLFYFIYLFIYLVFTNLPTLLKTVRSLYKQRSKQYSTNKQLFQQIIHNNDMNSSINSSTLSSNNSMISLQNNVNTVQNIFNNKMDVRDRKVMKVVLGIVLVCVCALISCSVKIYANYLTFGELRDIFFGDGACSDNLQLSMFVYSHALNIYNLSNNIHNASVSTSVSGSTNTNTNTNNLNILKPLLQQQIRHLSLQLEYLRNLITNEQLNMNNQITTLTQVKIYDYQNDLVLWSKYEYQDSSNINSNNDNNYNSSNAIGNRVKVDSNVTLLQFIMFYLDNIENIVKNAQKIMQQSDVTNLTTQPSPSSASNSNDNNPTPSNHTVINRLLSDMSNQMSTLSLNFPTLYTLNYQYLQYFVILFQHTKKAINLTGYVKIAASIVCIGVALVWINYYYGTREDEDDRIGVNLYGGHSCDVVVVKNYYRAVLVLGLGHEQRETSPKSRKTIPIRQKILDQQQRRQPDQQVLQSRMKNLNNLRQQLIASIQPAAPSPTHQYTATSSPKPLLHTTSSPTSPTSVVHSASVQFIPSSAFPTSKLLSIIIFSAVMAISSVLQITQNSLLSTSEKMIIDINGLMNSQNQLIGSYLKLKGEYMFVDNPIINPNYNYNYNNNDRQSQSKTQQLSQSPQFAQLLSTLLPILDRTQIQFNSVAVDSLALFTQYDASYSQKMIAILTMNICQLLEQKMRDTGSIITAITDDNTNSNDSNGQRRVAIQYDLIDQCRNDPQMKFINYGAVNGMTYFGRELQNILHLYLNNNNNNIHSVPVSSTQIPVNLPQIDKSLFPMLKIYQQTQSQITISLETALDNQNKSYISYIVLQQVIYFCIIVYVVAVLYYKQNRKSCQLICRILVVPLRIIKWNRGIKKFIAEFCDFDRFQLRQSNQQKEEESKDLGGYFTKNRAKL